MGKKRVADMEARPDSNAIPKGRGRNGEFSFSSTQTQPSYCRRNNTNHANDNE